MMRNRSLLLLFVLLFCGRLLPAQCGPGENKCVITIVPDAFPQETTWELRDAGGTVLLAGVLAATDSICLPDTSCLKFTIYDSFGDGICCTAGNGAYQVTWGGQVVAFGGQFGLAESTLFGNCSIGSDCAFPDTVNTGIHQAPNRDYWYYFEPDSTGTFRFYTCGLANCNTTIWIYDHCNGLQWDDTQVATAFYNDDACLFYSEIIAHMAAGTPYWVRIGGDSASCTGAIDWGLSYLGPIVDCMDTAACNYNPLATLPDTCYYPPDSNCTVGPDLMVVQGVLEGSLHIDTIPDATSCFISEGCMADYGERIILKFSTHIKNIGNQDYYIGDPLSQPGQFTFDNCHNHYHYEGYAEYLLYDSSGTPLPIGFKNGFCVFDLECSGGGTPKYGCNNMGISAGCGDIYDFNTPCQWIDITDIQPGRYTLLVRTNWDRSPDALGRVEMSYDNNWAQVCIILSRSALTGQWNVQVDQNCPAVLDCNGVANGPDVRDCKGNCGGSALRGDLDENLVLELADGQRYVDDIVNATGNATDCADLNADGVITVSDAALVTGCVLRGDNYPIPGGGIRDFCKFPRAITNIHDEVALRIGQMDFAAKYVDIEILNPDNHVVGYQFLMSGLNITQVDNLVPATEYPATPRFSTGGMVVGLSYEDSTVTKTTSWRPLVRLHYSTITRNQVCIREIIDIVNEDYEDVLHRIDSTCVLSVEAPAPVGPYNVRVFPNPFRHSTTFEFELAGKEGLALEIIDVSGQVVRRYARLQRSRLTIERGDLPEGLYFYRLRGTREQVGKLMIW